MVGTSSTVQFCHILTILTDNLAVQKHHYKQGPSVPSSRQRAAYSSWTDGFKQNKHHTQKGAGAGEGAQHTNPADNAPYSLSFSCLWNKSSLQEDQAFAFV